MLKTFATSWALDVSPGALMNVEIGWECRVVVFSHSSQDGVLLWIVDVLLPHKWSEGKNEFVLCVVHYKCISSSLFKTDLLISVS